MNNFYLGGDVSKGYCDFIILDEEKKTALKSFQLDDTAKGHHLLSNVLIGFASEHPLCKIISGVESTGGYENNWFESLCDLQDRIEISVARINPIGTHHSSRASLTRVITDKRAAGNIAEYLINYKDKIIFKKTDKFCSLRRHWKFVRLLTKQRTQLYNQLEGNLYNANPEILRYTKYGYPQWLLRTIMQYPTAKHLSKARISALSSIPYVSEARAVSLINGAKSSVASATDNITGELIISLVKQIISLTKLINERSKIIADNCQLPEIEILKSFNGIGDYSAIGLLLKIVSVDNFSSAKKLASFFGLHPVWKESGDGTSGMHISKQGSREARALLYNVAFTAIRSNPLIKEIYVRHCSRGMKKIKALVACMHKILRIIYGMLKNNEKFNPEKDKANSKKMLDNHLKSKKITSKLRRFQGFDSDAPVSNKQYRKRKQQEMSQNEITSLNTGSVSHCSTESESHNSIEKI
ncbi:MAG: IS110 family RNA-guided transposase [Ignavibacteriaceae bacterium]